MLLADDEEFKTTPDTKKAVTPDLVPKEKKAIVETPPIKASPAKISIVRSNNLQQKNTQKEIPETEIKQIVTKAPVVVQKKESVVNAIPDVIKAKPVETKTPVAAQKPNLQQKKPVINKTPIVIRPEQLLPKETSLPLVNKTPIVIRSDQLLPKDRSQINESPVKNEIQLDKPIIDKKPIIISPKQNNLNQSKEISSNTVQEVPSSDISTVSD